MDSSCPTTYHIQSEEQDCNDTKESSTFAFLMALQYQQQQQHLQPQPQQGDHVNLENHPEPIALDTHVQIHLENHGDSNDEDDEDTYLQLEETLLDSQEPDQQIYHEEEDNIPQLQRRRQFLRALVTSTVVATTVSTTVESSQAFEKAFPLTLESEQNNVPILQNNRIDESVDYPIRKKMPIREQERIAVQRLTTLLLFWDLLQATSKLSYLNTSHSTTKAK